MTNESVQQLAYPGVYQRESEIIPYSPRKQFRFMDNMTSDRTIKLESMKEMSIDQIVDLYKNGYMIESTSQTMSPHTTETAANDVTISSNVLLLIAAGLFLIYVIKK